MEENQQGRFVSQFCEAAHEDNPTAAAAAIAASPGAPAAPLVARELVSDWARDDLLSASAWLTTLPEGETKDLGIAALVSRLAPVEPESVDQWLGAISDPTRRDDAIGYTFHNWVIYDGAAALAWLETTSLNDAAKAALLVPPYFDNR